MQMMQCVLRYRSSNCCYSNTHKGQFSMVTEVHKTIPVISREQPTTSQSCSLPLRQRLRQSTRPETDRPVAYMNLQCSAARRGLWLTDINWKPQDADKSNNITKEMNKQNDKNVLWQRFLGGETLSFIRRSISLTGSFINTCLPWSQNPTGMSFTPDSMQTLRLSNRVV